MVVISFGFDSSSFMLLVVGVMAFVPTSQLHLFVMDGTLVSSTYNTAWFSTGKDVVLRKESTTITPININCISNSS